MKAEGRLLLKGHDGTPHGPFRWTTVRDWVAIGYLAPEDEVKAPADAVWSAIGSRPELFDLPPGSADAVDLLRARAREQRPLGPRAASYLARLGCPVPLARLNPSSAFHWVRVMEQLHPERADAIERWAAEEEANGRVPSATPDSATAEQIETLRALGHTPPPHLTRLEARRLISGPPSEEQLDRLKFYGMSLPDGACQEEAAEMISRQMRENWNSEEAYQAYRRRPALRQQRGERASPALKLRQSPALEPANFVAPASALGFAPIPAALAPDSPFVKRPRKRALSPWLAVALFAALGLLAAARWHANRNTSASSTPATAPADKRIAAATPAADAVTVLESPNPALGEKLKTFAAALDVDGIVPGVEPRTLINGRLRRVGDTIDPQRGVIVVKIDAEAKTVIFTDASGSLVQRRLE